MLIYVWYHKEAFKIAYFNMERNVLLLQRILPKKYMESSFDKKKLQNEPSFTISEYEANICFDLNVY